MINGKLLHVSASPHVRSKQTTRSIMIDVVAALIPALIASVIIFGLRALLVTVVSVIACVLSEYIMRKFILKRNNTIGDLSAVVTGILLAFNLPSGIPLWMVIVGDVFAIVIIKQCFGGIGQNFINPAIGGRIFMLLSFPTAMGEWAKPNGNFANIMGVDAFSGATPLAVENAAELPSLADMFFGSRAGSLGETCVFALILGGIYLIACKVIKPIIPLTYIGTVAVVMTIAMFVKGESFSYVIYQLLSGGLFLGAIFMATDYTTSPLTTKGKYVFAIGCGLITCLIRIFGSLPEGVSYSIALMNVLCPLIEKFTASKPFGTPKKEKKAKEATA